MRRTESPSSRSKVADRCWRGVGALVTPQSKATSTSAPGRAPCVRVSMCVCVCARGYVQFKCVCVCVFIKLHITTQSGPAILVSVCVCVCIYMTTKETGNFCDFSCFRDTRESHLECLSGPTLESPWLYISTHSGYDGFMWVHTT